MAHSINRTAPTEPRPTYYGFERRVRNGRHQINIKTPPSIPIGQIHPVPKGWDRGLTHTTGLDQLPGAPGQILDTSGRGHISPTTGRFTLEGAPPKGRRQREPMVGRVFTYDQNGQELPEVRDVMLPHLQRALVLDRVEHLGATIEIVPHQTNTEKLVVTERVMANTGLPSDASKIGYRFSPDATKQLEASVVDLEWIQNVQIMANPARAGEYICRVTFEHPVENGTRALATLDIDGRHLIDAEGKPLLQNPKQRLRSTTDIYQANFYTRETEAFRPDIDSYHGVLHLTVNRVRHYEIERPKELTVAEGHTVKIFPAAGDAAVKVDDNWIPLALREPIGNLRNIDPKFSEIVEGFLQHAIGPQVKLGEGDNFSGDYPRDVYFYGTAILATLTIMEHWGENFAINRGKFIRAMGAIHSGRTHCMADRMLYNSFADLMETNNEFFKKVSNFAEELNAPGVSEDAQMEIQYRLKAIRMVVVQEMIALMKAEKKYPEFYTQNADRYDYSEALFILSMSLAKMDVIQGRFLGWKGTSNVFFSWADMAEKLAGRTWYKWAFNKKVENLAIPFYLLFLGRVIWYPVDLTLFMSAWTLRTVGSGVNYCIHLRSTGLRAIVTGFWRNPSYELTFLKGYLRAAFTQYLYRNQYGDFARTAEANSGSAVPPDCIKEITRHAAATTATILWASGAALLGGLGAWLAFPFGVVGSIVGLSFLAKGLAQKGPPRTLGVMGGTALFAAGATLTFAGAPVVFSSAISIAVVANVLFGLYSLGMGLKSWSEMRKAVKYASAPVVQTFVADDRIWRGVRVERYGQKNAPTNAAITAFLADPRFAGRYRYDPLTCYFMVNGAVSAADSAELQAQGIVKGSVLASFVSQSNEPIPLQRYASEVEVIQANNAFERMANATATTPLNLQPLADLVARKDELKLILARLGVMDGDNRTHQGFTHPYRILSMEMLDLFAELELAICLRTKQMLADTDPAVRAEARTAFIGLMRETRNYTVVNLGRQLVRNYDLRLEESIGQRFKAFGRKFLPVRGS